MADYASAVDGIDCMNAGDVDSRIVASRLFVADAGQSFGVIFEPGARPDAHGCRDG